MSGYFNTWYLKNKERLSAKKKERYANDAEYRERAKENSRRHRVPVSRADIPEEYLYTSITAAEVIGITEWRLREWRTSSFFPTPAFYNGRIRYTSAQINLLVLLKDWFLEHGSRYSIRNKSSFDDLRDYIYANW